MTTLENDHMVDITGQNMPQSFEYPRENEGIFFDSELQFGSSIERFYPKKERAEDPDRWGNTITRWTARFSDGVKLGVNFCEPETRATHVAILETPAWFTNLHGFNEETQRAFGALGIPSVLVGHIGQQRSSAAEEVGRMVFKPWQIVREMREISLARQAHQMIEIHQHVADTFQIDNLNVFLHGNSRGGMVQFPALALAQARGVYVPFAMPVAPCFPKGFGKETAREMRQAPVAEVVNVGKLVVRNLFDMAKSGVNTINLSPKAMAYEIAHTKSLFNGDAGRFDARIDHSQNMLILAYKDDIAGMYGEWEQKFAEFPNVYVRGVPGAHLSIADKRTASYVLGIFGKYANQLHDGQAINELDHSHVRRPLTAV